MADVGGHVADALGAGEQKAGRDAETGREQPVLRFRDGEGADRSYGLERDRVVTIGRAVDVDLSLSWDRSVSSVHAEVNRVGPRWVITDEGISRNGTFVNGERVSGRRRLAHGDAIQIGHTTLIFADPAHRHGDASTVVDAIAATGTLTFIFTDLADSTGLMSRLGDAAVDRLRHEHFALLRSAARAHGGREVKSLGDGLMLVFSSVLGAVACAVAMQRQVAERNDRFPEEAVGLRVGLGTGEVSHADADYFGTPVVVAKRLCDQAEPGQVLLPEVVRVLLGNRGEFRFAALGRKTLKGLAEPLETFALDCSTDRGGL